MPSKRPVHVGAPDPERRNSPILEETDEQLAALARELDDAPGVCYLNDDPYGPEDHVCSGSVLLQCRHGAWVRVGSCDPQQS